MTTFNTHPEIGPRYMPFTPGSWCLNWDSLRPEPVYDNRTGLAMGTLMPRISLAVLRASPGIGSWSIPETDTRKS